MIEKEERKKKNGLVWKNTFFCYEHMQSSFSVLLL